jgi:hypothetical protein
VVISSLKVTSGGSLLEPPELYGYSKASRPRASAGTNAHGESDRIGDDRSHGANSGHAHNNMDRNTPVRARIDPPQQQPEHRLVLSRPTLPMLASVLRIGAAT